jgi:hypothetical protein
MSVVSLSIENRGEMCYIGTQPRLSADCVRIFGHVKEVAEEPPTITNLKMRTRKVRAAHGKGSC